MGLEKPVISGGSNGGIKFSNTYLTYAAISVGDSTYLSETPTECYAFMSEIDNNNFGLVKISGTSVSEIVHENNGMSFTRNSNGDIYFYNTGDAEKQFIFGYFY